MSFDTQAAVAPKTGPVRPEDRIATLDLIRGLAILGILAVNADGFAATINAYGSTHTWPFPNEGWTAISKWVVDAFFHEKFITLFSMLFGVSIFLVGGEPGDRARGWRVRRRVLWLAVFALIHGIVLWWGDVLLMYAWAGLWLTFCRGWKARRLFLVGGLLFGVLALLQTVGPLMLQFAPPEKQAEVMASVQPSPEKIAAAKASIETARASWQGAFSENLKGWMQLQSVSLIALWIPYLGLMMIGLGLFKTGFLSGRRGAGVYVLTALIGAAALALGAWIAWRDDVLGEIMLWAQGAEMIIALIVALGYASVLILLWKAGAAGWLKPLSNAGRMAFTNYITQSIIMTSIFYGGRGGLMGQVDRPALWAIVVAVWVLQLVWSSLWLAKFQMGPLEWVWRCLTYWRLVPIRKAAA